MCQDRARHVAKKGPIFSVRHTFDAIDAMVLARWSVYVRGFHTTARHLAKGKKSKGADAKRQLLPPGWEAVIGIECHAQLKAPTKLFSGMLVPHLRFSNAASSSA